MKIFVYEHLCAGGGDGRTADALLAEGRAMLTAVVADLTSISDVSVVAAWGLQRPPSLFPRTAFVSPKADLHSFIAEYAGRADWTLAIAPEIGGTAALIARWIEEAGGRLLGLDSALISLFADKLETAKRLGAYSIPSVLWTDPIPAGERLVVKPRDGVGALFTLVASSDKLARMVQRIREEGFGEDLVVQPYRTGSSASVGVLGRGAQPAIFLPAATQDLLFEADRADPSLQWIKYAGGRLPLSRDLQGRVHRLATAALRVLPPLTGYFGIDVILGCDDDGADDRVVEVNPRLTTTYVGYSRLLAGRMGRLLLGRETEEDLRFLQPPFDAGWKFTADGRLIETTVCGALERGEIPAEGVS